MLTLGRVCCLSRLRESLARVARRLGLWPLGRGALAMASMLACGLVLAGVVAWDDYHLCATRAALDAYELDQADTYLRRATGMWAPAFERHLLAAMIARRRGQFSLAEQELAQCERLKPKTDRVALERLITQAVQGDTTAAANTARTAWGQATGRTGPLFLALARGYLENQQPVEAIWCAAEVLKHVADDPEALFCRGRAWLLMQQPARALTDLRRAVDLAPGLDGVRLALADALYETGHAGEAAAQLEVLREGGCDDDTAILLLARCRHDLADPDAAQRLLEALLARQPDQPDALLQAAGLALRRGRPAAAEQYLQRLLARTPGRLDALEFLHASLRAQHKESAARACAERVTAAELEAARVARLVGDAVGAPPRVATCRELGTALLALGRDREALSWLFLGLRVAPDDGPTHLCLADYFTRSGQPDRARRHADRARNHQLGTPVRLPSGMGAAVGKIGG